jgi:hypothetical protein
MAVRAASPLQLTWNGTTATLTQPAKLDTPLGEITVSGSASTTRLDLTATGRLDLLRAQPLLGSFFDRTSGIAVLDARVTGNSKLPRIKVTLDLEDVALRLAGRDAMLRVPGGRIEFENGELNLTGIGVEVDDGYSRTTTPLTVAGGVTFKGFTPDRWALIVSGELAGEMLMAFAPETFSQASGAAAVSMTVTGSEPLVSGTLTFSDAKPLRLLPRTLRREISLDQGTVTFFGEGTSELEISIEDVGGKIDDEGTLHHIGGTLALRDGRVDSASVTASADALTFRIERTLDLVISLEAITATLEHGHLKLAGGVELTTGRYTRSYDLGEALTPTASSGPSAPPIWETTPLLGEASAARRATPASRAPSTSSAARSACPACGRVSAAPADGPSSRVSAAGPARRRPCRSPARRTTATPAARTT